jgi:polyvinyl alcohol dehydrogenase (cytochrome)
MGAATPHQNGVRAGSFMADARVESAGDRHGDRRSPLAGSSVNSGPAVVDGTVYWGSGYSRSGVEGSGNNRLYAFSIDGQ